MLAQARRTLGGIAPEVILVVPEARPPWAYLDDLKVPDWTAQTQSWEQLLEVTHGGQHEFEPSFLNWGFQPANLLWRGDRVSGLVDWVFGCVGRALSSVFGCITLLGRG